MPTRIVLRPNDNNSNNNKSLGGRTSSLPSSVERAQEQGRNNHHVTITRRRSSTKRSEFDIVASEWFPFGSVAPSSLVDNVRSIQEENNNEEDNNSNEEENEEEVGGDNNIEEIPLTPTGNRARIGSTEYFDATAEMDDDNDSDHRHNYNNITDEDIDIVTSILNDSRKNNLKKEQKFKGILGYRNILDDNNNNITSSLRDNDKKKIHISQADIRASPRLQGYLFNCVASIVMLASSVSFYLESNSTKTLRGRRNLLATVNVEQQQQQQYRLLSSFVRRDTTRNRNIRNNKFIVGKDLINLLLQDEEKQDDDNLFTTNNNDENHNTYNDDLSSSSSSFSSFLWRDLQDESNNTSSSSNSNSSNDTILPSSSPSPTWSSSLPPAILSNNTGTTNTTTLLPTTTTTFSLSSSSPTWSSSLPPAVLSNNDTITNTTTTTISSQPSLTPQPSSFIPSSLPSVVIINSNETNETDSFFNNDTISSSSSSPTSSPTEIDDGPSKTIIYNTVIYEWKLYGAMAVSAGGVTISMFIIIIHFDSICYPKLWNIIFSDGSSYERYIIICNVIYWIIGLYILTSSLSVGFVQTNVFFTAWIAFISTIINLGVWRNCANLPNLTKQIRSHYRQTTFNWIWVLIFSLITSLSIIEMYVNRDELFFNFNGELVKASHDEWVKAICASWSAVGSSILNLLCNHYLRTVYVLQLGPCCSIKLGWKHCEGLLLLIQIGLYFWVIVTYTGVNGVLSDPSNVYFGIWGIFFSSIFTFGTWIRETHGLLKFCSNDNENDDDNNDNDNDNNDNDNENNEHNDNDNNEGNDNNDVNDDNENNSKENDKHNDNNDGDDDDDDISTGDNNNNKDKKGNNEK